MTHLSPSFWLHTTSKCSDKPSKGYSQRYSIASSWGCEHISPHPPPLSLSAHRSWYTSIVHPVLTSRVYCFIVFYIFRYSLISIHLVKKNSTRTAVGVILNTLWWNAPMFYHLWCQTNAALMRSSTNNSLFSSNCTTWLIHVHPTWSEENILAVLHIIPLDLQFRHVQRHVR